jgi:hypothetical protein
MRILRSRTRGNMKRRVLQRIIAILEAALNVLKELTR